MWYNMSNCFLNQDRKKTNKKRDPSSKAMLSHFGITDFSSSDSNCSGD